MTTKELKVLPKLEPKERTYVLKGDVSPLSYFLQSRDTNNKRLLYYDEEENKSYALRYARNQNTIFQDEQDSTAILEPIVFEDGTLIVPKTNPTLQLLLHYHPGNVKNGGHEFYEFDPAVEAELDIEELFSEVDAMIAARQMDIKQMEAIGRIYLPGDVSKLTSLELKRDVLLFARNNPQEFMEAINDPDIDLNDVAQRAFDQLFVQLRGGKDIFYNLKENKKKILTVPFGEDAVDVFASWLQSEAGEEFYTYLKSQF